MIEGFRTPAVTVMTTPTRQVWSAFEKQKGPASEVYRIKGRPLRLRLAAWDSDGEVGQERGRRPLPCCTLYALRDQHTLRACNGVEKAAFLRTGALAHSARLCRTVCNPDRNAEFDSQRLGAQSVDEHHDAQDSNCGRRDDCDSQFDV